MTKLIAEVRRKRPGLSRRVDLGHPLAGIRMFCLACVGGSALDVKRCGCADCPLFRFRFGRRPGPVAGDDTSEEE